MLNSAMSLFYQLIFLLTGIAQTLLSQWIYYLGATTEKSMLTVTASYFSMILVYFLPREKPLIEDSIPFQKLSSTDEDNEHEFDDNLELDDNLTLKHRTSIPITESPTGERPKENYSRKLLFLAVVDIMANILATTGLFYIGSGIYQVIYSTVIVFVAILSRIFLKRFIPKMQMFWIFGITIGLGLSAIGTLHSKKGQATIAIDSVVAAGVGEGWIGIALTISGTVMYASVYVVTDAFFSRSTELVPEKASAVLGLYCTSIIGVYLMTFIFPNFQKMVLDPIEERQGSTQDIMWAYLGYTLSCLGHHWTYFRLLKGIGAVNTGILQSLRAVCVFGLSAGLFCQSDPGQCYNPYKAYSTVVVIICVIGFSWAGVTKPKS